MAITSSKVGDSQWYAKGNMEVTKNTNTGEKVNTHRRARIYACTHTHTSVFVAVGPSGSPLHEVSHPHGVSVVPRRQLRAAPPHGRVLTHNTR